MKSIAVFCGARMGENDIYKTAAAQLGQLLAEQGIQLVYGGAKIGLMGAMADAVLAHGGVAIGVIPHFLKKREVAHDGLTELITVESMHERKMKMNELCDGVIAMPGGFGTLEELFEIITWGQLGLHQKPIGLLDVNDFYASLLRFLDQTVQSGFVSQNNRDMLVAHEDAQGLLELMKQHRPEQVERWLQNRTT